jgi:4-amino-4-deoxy-L-arabinose transferase-like glycosyltransferase
MVPPDRSTRRVFLALAALTLLALAARFSGIRSGLPCHPEPLAVSVWQSAANHIPPGKSYSPYAYPSTFYPHLLSGVLDVMPGHSYAMPAPSDAPLAEHLAAASEPYLRGRLLIALLSSLVIPGVYFLARTWLEPRWALFAAALAATSLLFTDYSMTARIHPAVASTSVAAVLGALYLMRRGTLASYLIAGASAALSITTLYSGFFALPALFIAHWFAPVRSRRTRWIGLAAAVAIVAVSFRVAYPFLFEGRAVSGQGTHIDLAEQHIPWRQFAGRGFGREIAGMFAYDPVLVALACGALVIGLVALVARKKLLTLDERHAAFVAGSQVLGVFVGFGVFSNFSPRFAVPLVPGAAVLGAAAACWISRAAVRRLPAEARHARSLVQAAVALLMLALPAYACAHFVRLKSRPDTALAAAQWIESNTQLGDPILVDNLVSIPIAQDIQALELVPDWIISPWERYCLDWPETSSAHHRPVARSARKGTLRDKRIDSSEVQAVIAEVRPKWAVLARFPGEVSWSDETRSVVREIAGEPVARFSPCAGARADDEGVDEGSYLAQILRRDRIGVAIEIYRLPVERLAR